jgi:hypothetical protein
VVLKAAFGLAMTAEEIALFRVVAGDRDLRDGAARNWF